MGFLIDSEVGRLAFFSLWRTHREIRDFSSYTYVLSFIATFFSHLLLPHSHVQGAEYLYSYCCCAFFKCSFNSSSLSANPSAFSFTLFKYISLVIEGSLGIAIPFCTAGRALIRSHHLYKLGNFSRLTPAK